MLYWTQIAFGRSPWGGRKMELMERLNSVPMFLIAGAVIVMVMVLCVIFMVKSYRAGIAMGM